MKMILCLLINNHIDMNIALKTESDVGVPPNWFIGLVYANNNLHAFILFSAEHTFKYTVIS